MRKFLIAITAVVVVGISQAQAQRAILCEMVGGQVFVWVGTFCPAGSIQTF